MKKAETSIADILTVTAEIKAFADRLADLSEPARAVVRIIASAVTAEQPMPKYFEALAAIEQVIELHELCRRQQGELADLSASGVTAAAPEDAQQLHCIGHVTRMNAGNCVVLVNDESVAWGSVYRPAPNEPVYVIREKAAS